MDCKAPRVGAAVGGIGGGKSDRETPKRLVFGVLCTASLLCGRVIMSRDFQDSAFSYLLTGRGLEQIILPAVGPRWGEGLMSLADSLGSPAAYLRKASLRVYSRIVLLHESQVALVVLGVRFNL